MLSRERFLCSLSGKVPDKVPVFELAISECVVQDLAGLLNIRNNDSRRKDEPSSGMLEARKGHRYTELYHKVIEKLNLDAVCCPLSMGLKKISRQKAKDKYGVVYNLTPHGQPIPAQPRIRNLSDLKKLNMRSKLELEDFSDIQEIARLDGRRACCISIPGPFKLSWRLMGGMEALLLSFRENPELVHQLFRATADFILRAVDMAIDIGVDVFVLTGDLAFERQLFFSMEDYRQYLKPLHSEIVEYVHRKGSLIVKHSDGNVWSLLDEWVEVGFDGLHPVQPQCMNIEEVKQHLAGKMAVLGNIDCRNLLVFGSQREVRETVEETMERVAPGGGYIVSSSNSIHPGCKATNYIAMVEAVHQYNLEKSSEGKIFAER